MSNSVEVYSDGPLRLVIHGRTDAGAKAKRKWRTERMMLYEDCVVYEQDGALTKQRIWAPLSQLSTVRVGYVTNNRSALTLLTVGVLAFFGSFVVGDQAWTAFARYASGALLIAAIYSYFASRGLQVSIAFGGSEPIEMYLANTSVFKPSVSKERVDEIVRAIGVAVISSGRRG